MARADEDIRAAPTRGPVTVRRLSSTRAYDVMETAPSSEAGKRKASAIDLTQDDSDDGSDDERALHAQSSAAS